MQIILFIKFSVLHILNIFIAIEDKEFMQVSGANNSKFGVLVSKEEKYLGGKDYYGKYNMKQIQRHSNENKAQIPFTAGIKRNTHNRHSMKGNVEI